MKDKDKKRLADQRKAVVDRIVADMREKEFSWTQTWQSLGAPRNGMTGRAYRGGNRLSLSFMAVLLGYEDPRWVTYNQARMLGWRFRENQHSRAVVENWQPYMIGKEEKEGDTEAEGAKPGDGAVRVYRCVGCWNVFNAAQFIDVPPVDAEVIDDEEGRLADDLKASSRCPVLERPMDRVFYDFRADEIHTPLRVQYECNGAYVIDLLHEMGHSTGHRRALGRKLCGSFGSADYAFEELVAELSSVFCAQDLGLSAQAPRGRSYYESHIGYLQSWMKRLPDDPEELYRAARQASRAADCIMDRLDKRRGDAATAA